MSSAFSLSSLGWRPFHSQQLTLTELESSFPARVGSVHRNGLIVLSEQGTSSVIVPPLVSETLAAPITVGDWVMIEAGSPRVQRAIKPFSAITRQAAGTQSRTQSIAANLDTLFVVTSCNDDLNLSRLERYLAVAFEAKVEPVVVLTKADLCNDVTPLIEQVQHLARNLSSIAVNATDATSLSGLQPWLQAGQTVAFVGSSGVGKSTLVNTLSGMQSQSTGGIREHDSKGRHTTTSREMFALGSGAWIIDTPGMREFKIGAVESGLRTVFDNVEALASQCHFRDCRHETEAGCAVLAAVANGQLDARRLTSYRKLQREAAHAVMTTRERRELSRQFGRMHASAMRSKKKSKW